MLAKQYIRLPSNWKHKYAALSFLATSTKKYTHIYLIVLVFGEYGALTFKHVIKMTVMFDKTIL